MHYFIYGTWILILYQCRIISSYRLSKQTVSKSLSATISSQSNNAVTLEKDSIQYQAIKREDFPILSIQAYPEKPLIYLDSAASSQKPLKVTNAMDEYYKTSHANVHRGAHALAVKATAKYEWARDQVHHFINSNSREEIIFTKGATDAINVVALSYASNYIKAGDEIILSVMEHHSNLVPWQMVAQRTGAVLKFVNFAKDGSMTFDLDHYKSLLSSKTKLVAVAHASNVLGYVNPVEIIIDEAHKHGAVVLLDACQSVPHMPIDVQKLDVDFLVASSHKMCGPTGIGFLYGKMDLLKSMSPVFGGGEMIEKVELYASTYAPPPSRFEAGTPAIAEAVGLGAACEYLQDIGMNRIYSHELELGSYLYDQLQKVDGLVLYGPSTSYQGLQYPVRRTGLVAFNHKLIHPTDISFFLDQEGVAVRTGHHCTQPLHRELGISASMRASLYFYNNREDIDQFIEKLKATIRFFESMNS